MRCRPWLSIVLFLVCIENMSVAQQLSSKSTFFTIRLKPHQDLKKELMAFAAKEKLKAGFIVTCVGSLEQSNLRFANQSAGIQRKDHFEILSLVGTFSNTSAHLHLSIADSTGATMGGHLLDNNLIYTTAEIVIGELTDIQFEREKDSTYGYHELSVKKRRK
ncbi:MAG: PPC domain-containing DNA-binding protein [Cyclobacteriaceae bacterium]|jgi:predicted DNA-binding protein with PD1-like motif